jgi:hypothetical protein
MSSINSRRDVGHGVGGLNASINNVKFSTGTWAGWISDDEAFFANGDDGWTASIYDQRTKRTRRAVADESAPQFGAGMNTGYAGGGVWAGWLGSKDAQRGLFTSTGLHFPDAGLMAVGPTGELAFKPSYQSFGPVMVLEKAGQLLVAGYSAPDVAPGSPAALAAIEPQLRAEGLYWQLSALSGGDYQLLGGGRAIWQYGQRMQVAGLPQPLQLGAAYRPQAHEIDGRWWASYYSTVGGIILHPFNEMVGYTVVQPGIDCWHSARSFDSDVFFALFATEAEQNGWLREDLIETALEPRAPLKPVTPPLVLPAPTRKYWTGWFEFAAGPHGPGNALLAVRNIAGALDRPAIVTDESNHLLSGEKLGRLIGGATVEAIEAAAHASALRPVAYWDANAWPRWPLLPKGSWLCLRLYCAEGTSPEVFKAEGRGAIQAAPAGVPLMLVGQQYTSNATLVGFVDPSTPPPHDSEALKPLAAALVELANESPSVVALFLFSSVGRRGGLGDHPDLVQPWADFAAQLQAPALEPWPPLAPPDPPKPEPVPPSLYRQHKEHRMPTTQTVAIVGSAGLYGRPGKPNTGPWGSLKDDAGKPRNWRGVIFDGIKDESGAFKSNKDPKVSATDYHFELSMPDDRHQLYHAGADGFFGADATANATAAGSDQFYVKPAAETRGGFESPVIYEGNLTPKLLSGQIEYVANDGQGPAFVSCGFAVEVIS